jgi:hypothetical protein
MRILTIKLAVGLLAAIMFPAVAIADEASNTTEKQVDSSSDAVSEPTLWNRIQSALLRLRDSKKVEKAQSSSKKTSGVRGTSTRMKSSAVFSFELTHRAKRPPMQIRERAKLAGTLKIRIKGRSPKLGDEFEVLSAGWIEGKFEKLELPRLPKDLKWHIVYESIRDQRDHDRDGRADVRIIVVHK